MRISIRQGSQVLRRVLAFLLALQVTPALGSLKKLLEELELVIERLSAFAVEQDASERAFRSTARAARELARAARQEFMRPIARLAKAIFPNDPVLRQALAMPAARDYEGTIAAVQAMADQVSAHRASFEAAGLDADSVDRLNKVAKDVKSAVDVRADHFGRRSAATAGMVAELARGRALVRLLDAMVAPRLEGSPDKLAQWKTLARFVHVAPTEGTEEEVGGGVVGGPVGSAAVGTQATETPERDHAA